MATPLQTSNTIDFNSARISLTKPQITPNEVARENYSERRYCMAASLQTTLDIEQLLHLFLADLKPSVELDGLQYINETQQLQIVSGRKASHSCGYRLITANDHLGEIVFYRNTRFSDQNLQAIEEEEGEVDDRPIAGTSRRTPPPRRGGPTPSHLRAGSASGWRRPRDGRRKTSGA